jgi:plasmid maintenance system antidote protein VapI
MHNKNIRKSKKNTGLAMKLQEFLDANKLTATDFGNKLGMHRNTINNVLGGLDVRLSTAIAIEEATFNKVTCRDLLPQQDRQDLKKNKRKHQNDNKLEKPV